MAACCKSRPDTSDIVSDMSNWMANLDDRIKKLPLCHISIPGSHDSGSCSLQENGDLAPDTSKVVQDLCMIFGDVAKAIVYRWSVSQSFIFSEQLRAGIRYLDLRVAHKSQDNNFYFVHGLYGGLVKDGLTEVKSFLADNPGEVVLLDFNHFFNMKGADHKRLAEMICEVFGKKICPRNAQPVSITLENLYDAKQQVLVFYSCTNMLPAPVADQFWPGYCIPSPWPNTTKSDQLFPYLDKHMKLRCPNNFYVVQTILTPDIGMVITHAFSSLKDSVAKEVDPKAVSWLQRQTAGPSGVNVCILDFVEMSDYILTVINMNNTLI